MLHGSFKASKPKDGTVGYVYNIPLGAYPLNQTQQYMSNMKREGQAAQPVDFGGTDPYAVKRRISPMNSGQGSPFNPVSWEWNSANNAGRGGPLTGNPYDPSRPNPDLFFGNDIPQQQMGPSWQGGQGVGTQFGSGALQFSSGGGAAWSQQVDTRRTLNSYAGGNGAQWGSGGMGGASFMGGDMQKVKQPTFGNPGFGTPNQMWDAAPPYQSWGNSLGWGATNFEGNPMGGTPFGAQGAFTTGMGPLGLIGNGGLRGMR